MANSNIASLGRFSSQMLSYLGTQRTVQNVTGTPQNTYKYAFGNTVYPSPGNVQQSAIDAGVSGSFNGADYNSTQCFFLSRGASQVYADTMTSLSIDIASVLGVSTQSILENQNAVGQLTLDANAFLVFNELRDPSHQVAVATTVNNRQSLQAREIQP
jgi:hypothetical protein